MLADENELTQLYREREKRKRKKFILILKKRNGENCGALTQQSKARLGHITNGK